MIIGVSVVLVVFSYFAYRHLYTYADSTTTTTATSSVTTASSTASALSKWPFVSTILRSQSSLSESASDLKRIRRDGVPPSSFIVSEIQSTKPNERSESTLDAHPRRNDRSPEGPESPNTTPRARPVQPSPPASIPEISLLEPSECAAPDDDDDLPPLFPAANSAQRASAVPSSLAMPPPPSGSSLAMPPPPIPNRNPRMQAPELWNRPNPNPSAAARSRNLAIVGTGASGVAAGNGLTLPGRNSNKSRKSRVVLEPGHSPLDWARLQKSGLDLRVSLVI